MYNIRDFVPYDGSRLGSKHDVLIWSSATGYFFTQYANVADGQQICLMAD